MTSINFIPPECLAERRAVAGRVISDLRHEDRVEAYATGNHSNDEDVMHYVVLSDMLWGAFDCSVPTAIGGLHLVHPGVVQAWILGTSRFQRISSAILRFVRRDIISFLSNHGIHRMECYVWSENHRGRRWIRAAGGTEEGTLRRWGRNREDFVICSWMIGD